MRKLSLLPVFILALMLVPACGGGGDDDDDDDIIVPDADTSTPDADTTPTYDAAPTAITDEYLDETCSTNTDCGGLLASGDYACLVLNSGDTTGICASVCTTNEDCMDNYDGPSSGMPQCALNAGGTENYCAIVCTTNADCPGTHTCTDVGGGSICYANQ